jgi:methylamine---corrinoid protein Co-methyltransferase
MGKSFWEVADLAVIHGPKTDIRGFDVALYRKITELVRKYGIEYDPDVAVGQDDDLADRVFQAGKECYLSMGTYCMDSKRVIRFSEDDLDEALGSMRGEITLGEGTDVRRVFHRRPEESRILPFIMGGVVGGNATDEMQIPLYQSVAQETLVDAIYFDPPAVVGGFRVEHNSPLEFLAARKAISNLREATARAGRPGLHLLEGGGSDVASIGSCHPEHGIRPTDGICVHTTSELKADLDGLNKVAYSLQYGCLRQVWWAPVIGGFAGAPAGVAVAGVAGLFHALLVGMARLPSAYMGLRVTPHYRAGATDQMSFWILTLAAQAITRNSKAILQGSMNTSAGPGTLMMLYEIAASAISMVVSGMHIFGVRIHKPTKSNHGSGLESRWMAEVARAAVGLDRKEANRIVLQLLDRYREHHRHAPEGQAFEDLYDVERLTPKQDYMEVYRRARRELKEMGLPLSFTS